jgi:hypothetical protein
MFCGKKSARADNNNNKNNEVIHFKIKSETQSFEKFITWSNMVRDEYLSYRGKTKFTKVNFLMNFVCASPLPLL